MAALASSSPMSSSQSSSYPTINNHNMPKLNKSTRQNTSSSSLHASPLRNVLPPPSRKPTRHSLNDSVLSSRSLSNSRTKELPSFYNDRSKIYVRKSRIMSECKLSFQNKPITLSERKRFDLSLTEHAVNKRRLQREIEKAETTRDMPGVQRTLSHHRFKEVAASRMQRLKYGREVMAVNKEMLQRSVKRSKEGSQSSRKWESPFLEKPDSKSKLLGRKLFPSAIEKPYGNEDPTQIKVLNLDRLFREEGGKMKSVMTFPVVKISGVAARCNFKHAIASKDRIHEVIQEYNSLLRLMHLKKTTPRLGIKGTKFTKSPTMEELMGIKLGPERQKQYSESQTLSEQIFLEHCRFYKRYMKDDIHLARRILSGLTHESDPKGISLSSFSLFHQLFVSCTASVDQKVSFLTYFFLPHRQQTIELPVLRIILELMCEQLPNIPKLHVPTDLLSHQQKSTIFVEALTRVLSGEMERGTILELSRPVLKSVLYSNPDACDLLIQLLQKE